MNPLPHRIHRQRWLVKATSQTAAFAIRLQLRSELDTVLQPVFEHAFEMLGAGDDVVRIPRLSLELKLRPGEDFVAALSDALRDSLNEALQDAVIAHPEQAGVQRLASQANCRRTLLNYLASGQIEWHANTGDAESLARVLHAEAIALASDAPAVKEVITGSLSQRIAASFRLLQLLPAGSRTNLLAQSPLSSAAALPDKLPATAAAVVALLPIVLHQLAGTGVLGSYQLLRVQALLLALRNEDIHYPLEKHILALLHECLGQMTENSSTAILSAMLQVLLNSSPEEKTISVVRKKSVPLDATTLDSMTHESAAHAGQPGSDTPNILPDKALDDESDAASLTVLDAKSDAKSGTWPDVESYIGLNAKSDVKSSIKSESLTEVQSVTKSEIRSDVESFEPDAKLGAKPKAMRDDQTGIRSKAKTDAKSTVTSGAKSKARPYSKTDAKSGIAPNKVPDEIATTTFPPAVFSATASPDKNGCYPASDAGLVLLHPFLTRLFDAVGIAPAGTVELPEAMLPRAAALLHWLMSGREEIFEFELTTIKILLGLAPDRMLLVGAGLLSETDKEEADALLTAAIAHWSALGKTGAATLRMSFLQRRGLLRNIGSGWQLQVEPESFDMLLGKLPWGISIVRLPWMTRPIFTEWPTP